MSLRPSASLPSTCSGAMYCTVPRIVPCAVPGARVASRDMPDIEMGPAGARNFASPKSSSFGPAFVNMMLAGLRSRWMMPWRCALSSASAISVADLQRLLERERAFLEPCGQRLALEMRHDQIMRAIDAADIVDAADVGMIQGRDGASLALEAGTQIGIASNLTRQDLDGNRSIEACVAGSVNLAHAAGPEGGDNLIRAEAGAGSEGQTAAGDYTAERRCPCDYSRVTI